MRFCSISAAPIPSIGRPEIGGSGSPASSTSRDAVAACAPASGRPVEGEEAPTLPDVARGAIGGSALAAPPVAVAPAAPATDLPLPAAGAGVAVTVALVAPAWVPVDAALDPIGPFAAASGTGCGGSPPATRWRAADASTLLRPDAGSTGRRPEGFAGWLTVGGKRLGGSARCVSEG